MLVAWVALCVPSPQSHMREEAPETVAKNWTSIPFEPLEAMVKVKLPKSGGQVDTTLVSLQSEPQASTAVNTTV